VGEEIFVKIIDIDLDRRRISLSLKQANEGTVGEATGEEFDPTLYGMPATYDDQGNYLYPEGFDSESGDWLPGFDAQREEWERQYAEARARFEAHRRQIEESRAKAEEEGEAAATDGAAATSQSAPRAPRAAGGSRPAQDNAPSGTLASDEALAALRDKLSGQS
jgi:small subunit ribosomal protein S1